MYAQMSFWCQDELLAAISALVIHTANLGVVKIYVSSGTLSESLQAKKFLCMNSSQKPGPEREQCMAASTCGDLC